MNEGTNKYYKEITFGENRARCRLLRKFMELVNAYFNNSTLNMLEGNYNESKEATEARTAINLMIKEAYSMIRLAGVKTSAISTSSIAVGIKGQNIDLILNIFNLGRNNIPPEAAIEYIENAVDVYKSDRLNSFFRTINPIFWIKVLAANFGRKSRQQDKPQG